jgi:hypothetical protein
MFFSFLVLEEEQVPFPLVYARKSFKRREFEAPAGLPDRELAASSAKSDAKENRARRRGVRWRRV